MKWWACACLLASASPLWSADALEPVRRALAERLPQIALQLLKRPESMRAQEANPAVKLEALCLRVDAHLAAGEPDEALAALAPALQSPGDDRLRLLAGHCYARAGRWREARKAYGELAAKENADAGAIMGLAESMQALGDTASAIKTLESRLASLPSVARLRLAGLSVEVGQVDRAKKFLAGVQAGRSEERLWVRYIEGRIRLLEGEPAAARSAFEEILVSSSYLTENLLVCATLGAVDARIALQGNEAADNELETFIWRHPDSAWLELAFSRLDQIYAGEKNPAESELQKWAKKPQQRRAALAQYYVARLQVRGKKWDKALASLDTFVRGFPSHPLLAQAHLMRADVLLEKSDLAGAVSALEAAARVAGDNDSLRAEIELRTGLVQLRQREYVLAATSLDRAAERQGPAKPVALYDAAIAWLHQRNFDRFQEEYRRLCDQGASAELRGNLRVEDGLTRARLEDPKAATSLREFLDEFPSHPRASEARLALAELAFSSRRLTDAGQLLQVALERPHSTEVEDQAQYLAIFLADARTPRDDQEVLRLAREFVRTHPKSPHLDEVRMKLGEVYFRQTDYPNAETQFANLAEEAPASSFAEAALFLAGQAAMRTINTGSTERALKYFDQVVNRSGALRLHAREQQAIIQSNLGKEVEAIALYDLIIESRQPVPDPELKHAALVGKADALLRSKPARAEAAVEAYDSIVNDPEATSLWRDQALYKKAKALDQLGRKQEAVATFHDVLDRNIRSPQRDLFWFYKAGFEAARYYEEQSAWPSAVAIYEKIGSLPGPSATEATERAKRLRIEHFIWD